MSRASSGLLARGDNLEVLRGLMPKFAGRCRLVLADPPYNARNRKDYPDDLDSSQWLSWLAPRLDLVCQFLSSDGILACHIDDSEQAALQVALDRMLGRERRINTVCVKMSELSGVKMRYQDRLLPRVKEYVLLYGAGPAAKLRPLRRPKSPDRLVSYAGYYRWFLENPDDPVESWKIVPLREAAKSRGLPDVPESQDRLREEHPERCVYRTNNRWFSSLTEDERPRTPLAQLVSPWGESYVWWEGRQMLFLSDHLDEPLSDLWTDISTINLGREGGVPFPSGKKPEALVERLMELCTDPGDLVLDPFCGSGTTAAVAHKTGRDWISVELDPDIAERARQRIERVVAGADPTGITAVRGWTGGGSFHTTGFAARDLPHAGEGEHSGAGFASFGA
jgi:adenine-specific DNA-methyltransferase